MEFKVHQQEHTQHYALAHCAY